MNGTQSFCQMMPLTTDKQQQQQLSQSTIQTGQSSPNHEETGPALLVRHQQEPRQQGHGQREDRADLWRLRDTESQTARDTQSQVTLCRQQQMLIYELRRQLEQSRRALIEAQAGELKLGTEQPSHRPDTTQTAGDFATSPTAAQTSADTRSKLSQISAGSCSRTAPRPAGSSAAPELVPTIRACAHTHPQILFCRHVLLMLTNFEDGLSNILFEGPDILLGAQPTTSKH